MYGFLVGGERAGAIVREDHFHRRLARRQWYFDEFALSRQPLGSSLRIRHVIDHDHVYVEPVPTFWANGGVGRRVGRHGRPEVLLGQFASESRWYAGCSRWFNRRCSHLDLLIS